MTYNEENEELPEPQPYSQIPEHLKAKARTAFTFFKIIKHNYPDFEVPKVVNLK